MNILQIVSSSRTSGAEKHVLVLSEQLRRRGHQVTVLCPPGEWLPGALRDVGVPVRVMPMHGPSSLGTLGKIVQCIREQRIDIIHTHLTCACYFGFLSGRRTGVAVVSSVHTPTHDFVYRRLLPRGRNRIITVSEFVRNALIGQRVAPTRIRTIYNGTEFCDAIESSAPAGARGERQPAYCSGEAILVGASSGTGRAALLNRIPATDEETLRSVRTELELPADALLIGIFARVEEFKGHRILAQALRRIVAAYPDAYLICVGDAAASFQHELEEIASHDGVSSHLRFTGERNDVQRLMSAMDIVALPSEYEACSMAIIEAMALGKPVVATRAGGNPELIRHGETGLLIERNQEMLANALITLLSSADRRIAMGRAAQQRAREHFSAQVMVTDVEALYHEVTAA